MAPPTARSLSRLFSQLAGSEVVFIQTKEGPDTKSAQVYGIYKLHPDSLQIVVKADLLLVGSFAGGMIGLPDSEVKLQLGTNSASEPIHDAIHEVFNVASNTILPGHRTVLADVVTDFTSLDEATSMVLTKPGTKYCFNASVKGRQGGQFAILVQGAPAIGTAIH